MQIVRHLNRFGENILISFTYNSTESNSKRSREIQTEQVEKVFP